MTAFIGDVHCLSKGFQPNFFQEGDIQVGDLCLKPYHKMARFDAPRFFIEGNHDCYPQINENNPHPYMVSDYGVITNLYHIPRGFARNGVLFVGGAFSIDHMYRTEGRDWWGYREELSYGQVERCLNVEGPINLVVAHDCPSFVYSDFYNIDDRGSHSRALQTIFEHHRPKMWIHGHHHVHTIHTLQGCEFVCLSECQRMEFPDIQIDLGPTGHKVYDPTSP